MIKNINDLKKALAVGLPDSFRKDELLDLNKDTIKNVIITIDSLEDSLSIFKDKVLDNTDGYILLEQIASEIGIKSTKVSDVLLYFISLLNSFKKDSADIQKYIVDMEDIVIKDNIKIRDAAMYMYTNDIYFINRFILDILSYILSLVKAKKLAKIRGEDLAMVSDMMLSNEGWYKLLTENYLNFTDLIVNKYSNFSVDVFKDNDYDTIIPLKNVESDGFLKTVIDKILGKKNLLGVVGFYNFKYNPIYIIGKMIIKAQVAKAKSMRDKQEMIKYKILDVKAMNEKGEISNEKMEKAIAHYQEQIDDLEYKINKILDN